MCASRRTSDPGLLGRFAPVATAQGVAPRPVFVSKTAVENHSSLNFVRSTLNFGVKAYAARARKPKRLAATPPACGLRPRCRQGRWHAGPGWGAAAQVGRGGRQFRGPAVSWAPHAADTLQLCLSIRCVSPIEGARNAGEGHATAMLIEALNQPQCPETRAPSTRTGNSTNA
jgi:hypothetical protein